jgi:hypothetical protein
VGRNENLVHRVLRNAFSFGTELINIDDIMMKVEGYGQVFMVVLCLETT